MSEANGQLTIGVDLGSTAIKLVVVKEGKMIWKKAVPTAPGQARIVDQLMAEGLTAVVQPAETVSGVAVTGYGKGLVNGVHKVIDEVSANALGMHHLSGGKARTIINIGGQDVKVIRITDSGRLRDFKMNDKCAAGTGRFFEVAARILDTPVSDFGPLGRTVEDPANINSTCTVFAESEMVSLMAEGVAKERIIQGLHQSVARRIANLAGDDLENEIYLDGGAAANSALGEVLADELYCDLCVLPHPQFTVAYGAARSLEVG